MRESLSANGREPREGYVQVDGATLLYREVGQGKSIIVLHGGPEFDHTYLLPELDWLSDSFRLIYYDQRGRGRSAAGVQPADVSLTSEMEDLERVREHFGLESVALLGHSWGGLLALEYAARHPERVSRLILMNTAPITRHDLTAFVQSRRDNTPDIVEQLHALSANAGYLAGDPDAAAAYYRVHFSPTIRQPDQLESFVANLLANATSDGILRARAIEHRLLQQTWLAEGYDLLSRLNHLTVPTLIVHGDYDFIPVECVKPIADAMSGSRFVLLRDCGHFSYRDQPDEVRAEIIHFMEAPS